MTRAGRQTYKFVVDCNLGHCAEIQKRMKAMKFHSVKAEDTWLGDHYGLKEFDTEKQAEEVATKLFNKYYEKLNQITIHPLKE